MNAITISLIAGLISFAAYFIYIYDIWWGNTRPSRSSWWILTVVWTVTFLSSLTLGNQDQQLTSTDYYLRAIQIGYIVGSLIIAISTIWRGVNDKWTKSDWTCAALAAAALILYFVFSQPLISLLMGIVADLAGIMPTIKNAHDHPEHEHKWAWTIESGSSILALGGITVWSMTNESIALWSPVVYLIVINTLITIILWRKRKK